ncbi:MAG: PTS sugar transporter subunit IIC [Deltaproteobacteria bacterium]|jgi:hypothetical protein|nr:PTS sugar transporter subunit IIC [Deltaproteobacteria bacterium]
MLAALAMPLLAAAFLSLDRRAFMQTMLGRPLVTGALVGLCVSEPLAGLSLGLWTELLWLWKLTSGGYYTPNTPLALSAVIIALFGAGAPGPADWQARAVLGFAMVPCLAHGLIRVDVALRRLAGARSERLRRLMARMEAGHDGQGCELGDGPDWMGLENARSLAPKAFRRAALAGVPETFLASVAALAVMIPLARLAATALAAGLPDAFWGPVAAFAPYAPAAGLLGIASSLSRPYLAPYVLGALCTLLALAVSRALGGVALP